MNQILRRVLQTDKKSLITILVFNIFVALTSSISIVMLVPMLDLLDVSIGSNAALQTLLMPFSVLSSMQRGLIIITIFVLLIIARALLARFATIKQNAFLERYELSLRGELYEAVRRASWESLTAKPHSELINLFTAQCRQARICLQQIISFIASAFTAIMQLVIALVMSLPITIVVLLVGGCFLVLFKPFQKRSREYGKKAVEVNKELYYEIQNQLSSIKEIRAYGVEHSHAETFDAISESYYETGLKAMELRVLPQFCYSIAAAILVALAFVFSVFILDTGTAQLMVLVYIFSRLWPLFSSWQGQLQTIQAYIPSYETIQKAVKDLTAEYAVEAKNSDSLPFAKEVKFDKVGFAYRGSNEAILQNVSFTLPYGSVIALIGPSGAGKSTTADLLLGLLYPTVGKIAIDGHDLSRDDLFAWRRSIGYIPQEPLILNASVRENLQRFHPQATEDEMIAALKKAKAWQFVEKLSDGLETVLGDRGVRLSGGERQRIVLARVLMGDPRLIILDEATSALDFESENAIRDTIRSLQGKTTVLVIAHRLATIKGAERVIVLDNGHVAEEGTMQELMAKQDGYLARMINVE